VQGSAGVRAVLVKNPGGSVGGTGNDGAAAVVVLQLHVGNLFGSLR